MHFALSISIEKYVVKFFSGGKKNFSEQQERKKLANVLKLLDAFFKF
jgi:hypothetical protein